MTVGVVGLFPVEPPAPPPVKLIPGYPWKGKDGGPPPPFPPPPGPPLPLVAEGYHLIDTTTTSTTI